MFLLQFHQACGQRLPESACPRATRLTRGDGGEAVAPVILPAPTPGSGDEPSVMDTTPSEPSCNSQNSTSTADNPVATQSTLASPSLTYAEAVQSSQELFSPSSEASEGVGPSKCKAPPPTCHRPPQRTRARQKNRLTIRAQFSRIS